MIGPAITTTICQYKFATISCPQNKKINIKFAMYGRVSRSKCPNKRRMTKCVNNIESNTSFVKSKCESKQSCKLTARQIYYGDPCSGVSKYLEVKHTCE